MDGQATLSPERGAQRRLSGAGVRDHAEAGERLEAEVTSTDEAVDVAARDLLLRVGKRRFSTILADPPWQFQNRTGKMAPEHKRLSRYGTMLLPEIMRLPVAQIAAETAHLYLWVPNALLLEGLQVMSAWGFTYKTNIVWHKVRKDGGPDGRGVGFYFRNTTELVLFGVRGKNARTLQPGRRQVNIIKTQKREHSRKPDELYDIIQACSSGPYMELFARGPRKGWEVWGNQADDYAPTWSTYSNHSQAQKAPTSEPSTDSKSAEPKKKSQPSRGRSKNDKAVGKSPSSLKAATTGATTKKKHSGSGRASGKSRSAKKLTGRQAVLI